MSNPDYKSAYSSKPNSYFGSLWPRADFVRELPDNPAGRILEIGCGSGNTGQLALNERKCSQYIGVDIDAKAIECAKRVLTDALCLNVEADELPFQPEVFDALLMSEVLEHLVDPWETLKRLLKYVKPGGLIFASSPNIGHKNIIIELLKGKFELTDHGPMDRTHMRWFTPQSYREMFEMAGVKIYYCGPFAGQFSSKAKLLSRMTLGKIDHLLIFQILIKGHKI